MTLCYSLLIPFTYMVGNEVVLTVPEGTSVFDFEVQFDLHLDTLSLDYFNHIYLLFCLIYYYLRCFLHQTAGSNFLIADLRKSTLTRYRTYSFPNSATSVYLYKEKLSKEQEENVRNRVEPLPLPLYDVPIQIDPMLKMKWNG